ERRSAFGCQAVRSTVTTGSPDGATRWTSGVGVASDSGSATGDPALGAERDVDVAAVPDSTRVEDALAATAPAVGREGGERSASTAVGDGRRGPEVAVFAAAREAASD